MPEKPVQVTEFVRSLLIDFSPWRGSHTGDNTANNVHLLKRPDAAPAQCVGQAELPARELTASLQSYTEDAANHGIAPQSEYPAFLTAPPYQ